MAPRNRHQYFQTLEGQNMKDLISVAVLIATLYGGSIVGDRIIHSVREAALTKAASGLPRLSSLSRSLTSQKTENSADRATNGQSQNTISFGILASKTAKNFFPRGPPKAAKPQNETQPIETRFQRTKLSTYADSRVGAIRMATGCSLACGKWYNGSSALA